MKPPAFFFLDGQHVLARTVTDSQVLEFLELQSARGRCFGYVNVLGARDFLRNRTAIIRRLTEIGDRAGAPARALIVPRPGSGFGRWMARFLLLVLILWRTRGSGRCFLHARGHTAVEVALPVRALLPSMRILFDARGDMASEMEYAGQRDGVDEQALRKSIASFNAQEKSLLEKVDVTSCVSGALRDHLLEKHGLGERWAAVVLPCAADSVRIYPDRALRKRTRSEYALGTRRVLLYSGNVGMWHEVGAMLSAFRTMLEVAPDALFAFLTPEVKAVREEMRAAGIPEGSTLVLSVPHGEMNRYLNMADFGILLRRRHPLNAAASPTKFAEYLLAGLPVLISDGIGDASSFVREHDAGVVVTDIDSVTALKDGVRRLIGATFDRERIRADAQPRFAKQAFLGTYDEVLERLDMAREHTEA